MPATYTLLNGDRFKLLSPTKACAFVILNASDGRTKSFMHEFETTDGSLISAAIMHEQANALLLEFENNPNSELPSVGFPFGEPQELVAPNS